MCGIAGYYSPDNLFSSSELKTVGESIISRGPDNQGEFADEICGLVHRRLKIIDLSDNSNQPMLSQDNRYVIVYNGEVYNFDDIRREQQIQVRTNSDTEIILECLTKFGTESIEWFNGMFAIALYDKIAHKLLVVRDRMGVKPLYYYWDGKNFAFASEIKALLQFSTINKSKSTDYNALNQFLHLGYTGIEKTIYANISKFPAGMFAEISTDGLQFTQYWSTYQHIENQTIDDYYQAKETLRDLVEQSVRYRLKSDVPYGTFLSGGIDSSLITAVAQRNLSQRLNTFTIAFEESKHDESSHAKKIADYLGTNHHELTVTQQDALKLIPSILDTYDEPFADSSAIPTMLVSQLARKHVTMALSGDGGDELFMGYGAYQWAKRLENPTIQRMHKSLSIIAKRGNSWSKRIGNMFDYPNTEQIPSHIFSQEQCLFSRRQIKKILNNDFYHEFTLNEQANVARSLSAAENQALFDMSYYLREDLLTKVDRASMKYSLEVRPALLDYNIVEFSLNLNENLKMRNKTQKYLLKQVLYDYIPQHLFDRPKWGFSIPLCEWLHKDLHYLINDYLNQNLIAKIGIFNPKEVAKIVRKFESGRQDYLYNRIWQMILVQKFFSEKF